MKSGSSIRFRILWFDQAETRCRDPRCPHRQKATSCWLSSVPCSADNEDAVCDYINRLAKVNDKVSDRLILIPRIYTNKPRTTGDGYKGYCPSARPRKKEDFLHGLIAMRHMHIRALSETGLSAADEMLYPENWGYVSDILSYVAIGMPAA